VAVDTSEPKRDVAVDLTQTSTEQLQRCQQSRECGLIRRLLCVLVFRVFRNRLHLSANQLGKGNSALLMSRAIAAGMPP
jgi:hypothetical protein